MGNFTLQTKMLILLLVPILLILSGLGLYTYYSAESALNEQITQSIADNVSKYNESINSSMKEKESLVAVAAAILGEKELTETEKIAFMQEVKASRPGVKSVFIGYEDKRYLDSEGVTERGKVDYDPRVRGWYKSGVAATDVGYSEVYESSMTKELCVSLVKKVMRNGQVIGVVGLDIDIKDFQTLAQSIRIGKTGYAFILDEKGSFLYHPTYKLTDSIYKVDDGSLANHGKIYMSGKPSIQVLIKKGIDVYTSSAPIGKSGWVIGVAVPKAEFFDRVRMLGMQSLLSSILGIGIVGFIIVMITRNLVRRIRILDEMASNVAAGNLDIVCRVDANDEVGSMTRSFEKIIVSLRALVGDTEMLVEANIEGKLMIRADASKHSGEYRKVVEGINHALDAVIAPIEEVSNVLKEMSNGNLGQRVTGDYKGDHAQLKTALNKTLEDISTYINEITEVLSQMSKSNFDLMINNEYKGDFTEIKDALNVIILSFNQVFNGINRAADQVSAGAKQVSDGSQASAQGATEQASSVEELTVTIGQVAVQTKENALNANKANELALKASGHAQQGNEHMMIMLESMAKINESSGKISKIIKVIDEIAFQTNILALNAAVEAARAGQHGKGFAVVAEEVRNLAARSANAAKETTELIEGSVRNVEYGMRTADGTTTVLQGISHGVAEVVEIVKQIAGASNEQATAISQVNQGIEQVARVIQTNSATAQESAAASEELSGQAEMLRDMVGKFKLKKEASGFERIEPTEYGSGIGTGKQVRPVGKEPSSGKVKISLSDKEFGKY